MLNLQRHRTPPPSGGRLGGGPTGAECAPSLRAPGFPPSSFPPLGGGKPPTTTFLETSQAKNLPRSEEHTSELQSPDHIVCRLLLEKKNNPRYDSGMRRAFTCPLQVPQV